MFASEWALGAANAKEALQLRRQVLIEELRWPEEAVFDSQDAYAAHLLIREEEKPVACARLFALENGAIQLSHICVLQGFRKQRYGDLCFRLCMNKAAQMLAPRLEVLAPDASVPYFLAFGFTAQSKKDGVLRMQVNPAEINWHTACKK